MASVPAGLFIAAVALSAALGPGVAAAAESVPEEEPLRFETTVVASDYILTLERDNRPVAGRETTYTVTVESRADRSAPASIRISLPPWLSEVVADRDGRIGDGFVEWPVTVEPDRAVTVNLTGVYAAPGSDEAAEGPVRVVVTACVLAAADGTPVVCATDIGELDAPAPGTVRWLAVSAVLMVSGALLWREWRRRRPSPSSGPVPAAP